MIKRKSIAITINDNEYTVLLNQRKTVRRLILRIDSKTKEIHLSHPAFCSRKYIDNFLSGQHEWIEKHIAKIPERIYFIPQQKILFYGDEYLIIHEPKPRGIYVYEDAEKMQIIAECKIERVARAVESFLKQEALETLHYIAEQKAQQIGKKITSINIRDTKSRWGSCTSQGKLSFSWRLIMAPPYVVDYLVSHEVAHLLHMNHSEHFWKTCVTLSHDMAKAKSWLRKNGTLLHSYSTGQYNNN